MKRTALLLILSFSLVQSYACAWDEMSFLWWYFKSDIICSGKVIQVLESDSSSYNVKLIIDKIYKGGNLDTLCLTVNSYHEGGNIISDCDVYMKAGEQWLIYAYEAKSKYQMWRRSDREEAIKKFYPQDFNWLDSIDCKVTDFSWDWKERDIGPKYKNIDSLVCKNFDIQTVDTSTVHGIWAYVLCSIDEVGNLTKSNLFYYPKGYKKEILRETYGKFEYLNPETKCFTDFQKESVRVTELIRKWTPSAFCGKTVKSHVLVKYVYENYKLRIEMNN